MEEAGYQIAEKVQALSDIELAVLLCLVADQHCIIECDEDILRGLEQELRLITSDIFRLTCSVLECSENTTPDDFGNGMLINDDGDEYVSKESEGLTKQFSSVSDSLRNPDGKTSKSSQPFSSLDSRKLPNVVIAKNLNLANPQVQVQALELMRGKRIYTRTAVHAAPRPFLFITLNASGTARLTLHLNDQFFISHKHQTEDGLANVEELQAKELPSQEDASTSSVVHTPLHDLRGERKPSSLTFSEEEIKKLAALTSEVQMSTEVRAYLHNIVVFMRLHRAVGGGISAMASRHFDILSHALAPLHGISYVSPSLVALAARKIYPHRIVITSPENERSMQWGSSLEAVKAVLDGVTVEDVIEEVLECVEVPL